MDETQWAAPLNGFLGVRKALLPDDALLARYRGGGHYADCWITDLEGSVTHARFVETFYTTWVFRIERVILKWVRLPSTDDDVRRLAAGQAEAFAAWTVEDRAENQLLLCDIRGRTRSWLKVEPRMGGTRLFFGSAVVNYERRTAGRPVFALAAAALMAFHKAYSVILLAAARRRLSNSRRV